MKTRNIRISNKLSFVAIELERAHMNSAINDALEEAAKVRPTPPEGTDHDTAVALPGDYADAYTEYERFLNHIYQAALIGRATDPVLYEHFGDGDEEVYAGIAKADLSFEYRKLVKDDNRMATLTSATARRGHMILQTAQALGEYDKSSLTELSSLVTSFYKTLGIIQEDELNAAIKSSVGAA